MDFLPIVMMKQRVDIDRQDSDATLFMALLLFGEMVVKIVTAAMVAAVMDDRDRHRYRNLHRLVRADGLGDWVVSLRDVLTGPASQHLDEDALPDRNEITQRHGEDSWQHTAITKLCESMAVLDIQAEEVPHKVSCIHWLDSFVVLRNKTRGHGAKRSSELARACAQLEGSIQLVVDGLSLFRRPWAYLHRNLSGKYRVTAIGGDRSRYDELTRTQDVPLEDGVYVSYTDRRCVELIRSDADASDFWFPNGGFNQKRFELVSYVTGDTIPTSADPFLRPADELPPSETHPLGKLDIQGRRCWGNLPALQHGYIPRPELEKSLRDQLLLERHPIISLTGPGGIGKTSVALGVLHDVCAMEKCRYQVVVWFSARDMDLLPEGPKTVRPQGVSLSDFAGEFVSLLEPSERREKGFDPVACFAKALSDQDERGLGPALIVFDNFETVQNPADMFAWLDTHVRTPNKVLITTRIRGDFVADYPVQVRGMTDHECRVLIDFVAKRLGIKQMITEDYCQEIIRESEGHPYVIKVLLGEVAKAGHRTKVERIVAGQDQMLVALFERTFASLSPPAKRVLLTLSCWRSTVPELALEAVLLNPKNERIDVRRALEDLTRSSFVEEIKSLEDGEIFLSLPLAASLFCRNKLAVSPWRPAVEADAALLRVFGAAQKADVKRGIEPRVQRLFKSTADAVASGRQKLPDVVPMLEFVARKHPSGWLMLADLYQESDVTDREEKVVYCLEQYLIKPSKEFPASRVWMRIADLRRERGDVFEELHALAEMCKNEDLPIYVLSNAASRVNSLLRSDDQGRIPREERGALVGEIATRLEARLAELDGAACSRLGWLLVHLRDEERALQIAKIGQSRDPSNEHCDRLVQRLSR